MTNQQAEFCARLWEILNDLRKLIPEFETTFKDSKIKLKLSSVQDVYMHEIIISLWMILGSGANDKFTLSKLQVLFTGKDLKNKASTILNEHHDLIEKLGKNRNWISVHRDPKLMGLGYSNDFVKKIEKRFQTNFPQLRSKDKMNERYTPVDMKRDLPEIKEILESVNKIWNLIPSQISRS
jgi:hypothetical protein